MLSVSCSLVSYNFLPLAHAVCASLLGFCNFFPDWGPSCRL